MTVDLGFALDRMLNPFEKEIPAMLVNHEPGLIYILNITVRSRDRKRDEHVRIIEVRIIIEIDM